MCCGIPKPGILECEVDHPVSYAADGITVDGASVIMADIETSNGVIHVIDAVIMPGM